MEKLTPDFILQAYKAGLFPMAETAASAELHWFDPPMRGILPLNNFHIPKKLKQRLRQRRFSIHVNRDFPAVIKACAQSRPESWINAEIIDLYTTLHNQGHVHSVETWHNDQLCGGLYGVSIGGAFFGESMFARKTDASKIALVHLVARLWRGGYSLLDTQFINEHLQQFGAKEISRAAYLEKLNLALTQNPVFIDFEKDYSEISSGASGTGSDTIASESALLEAFLQSTTQTS